MDNMEDSGFDSDQKCAINGTTDHKETDNDTSKLTTTDHVKLLKKTSELQKKIEKQRDKSRGNSAVKRQPGKKPFMSMNRLLYPNKKEDYHSSHQDQQPLVAIMSDDSEEDEFAVPRLSKAAQREITQQLIKDGYNLDLEPDDEDLDLIPPRPLNERCSCCQFNIDISRCSIQ
ncbi:hypothetical protein ACJMK2_043750 [Sinanodonta woodiana]|uniref:Protein FAM219A n=1 Tax=Sinanodonta woodiana TaxID=1069815 RepID=A0ABD3VXX7_SINWO